MDVAPLSDYAAENENALSPLLWLRPELFNIRFVYYVVEKYDPDLINHFRSIGYVMPMTHILFKNFRVSGHDGCRLRFPINESVGCLNTIIMLPFQYNIQEGDDRYVDPDPTNSQQYRNRLTRYHSTHINQNIESVQWIVGGKRSPEHKLYLTEDREGMAFEYMVRWGEIGPHNRLDMYQGVFNGFSRFPVLLIPLSHDSYQSDMVAFGVDLRDLAQQVTVELTLSNPDIFRLFTYLQCTGVLFMTAKGGPQWYR